MQHRKLTIRTNFNHKLDCDLFIHIQVAQSTGIPGSTIIEMSTADGSHPPVLVSVIDSVRQKLKDLSSSYIYLSHGIDREKFVDLVMKADPSLTEDTEMVVYFYKKVEDKKAA